MRSDRPRDDVLLEVLVEHDVGVDRDADGHDDAGDAGEGERQALVLAEVGDDRPQQCGRDRQAAHGHEAEQPVVDHHVEEHEGEADEAGGDAGVEGVLAEAWPTPTGSAGPRARPGSAP